MNYTPCILRETSEGTISIPLRDALFQRREIYCTGEITPEVANSIIVQLHFLAMENPDAGITLYINSPGGEVASGLAVYDTMQSITAPVNTVCTGTAASMAAVLFAAGDSRAMFAHSRIMIHDPMISGGLGGSAMKIDSVAKDIMRQRETLAGILAHHTQHSIEEVYAKTATDCYFTAQEALAWGLADYVISAAK